MNASRKLMDHIPVNAPPTFHLLAKPSGSTCNLDCTYCFFLSKEALYPGSTHRMSHATLETYIRQLLESHRTPSVTVAWQGGEPTLMTLDFFKRSVAYVEKYRRPGQQVQFTFQTNGILLDDGWCAFLNENRFLVGLSVDGPEEIHDTYRLSKGGQGTFRQVVRALDRLKKHGVDFNILCTVHSANQHQGRRVYEFFRDELEATWMQFIPIVERATAETLHIANQGWSDRPEGQRLLYTQKGNLVTERSVGGEQYGRFLIDIYETWLRHDVGRIYVQLFDVTLHAYFGQRMLCIHAPTCGFGPALEHNGDVYSCDHFVEPDYLLGNIHKTHMLKLISSATQREFGDNKRDTLTRQCQECDVRVLCNGGCPKDRFMMSKDGEQGQNYLCDGLFAFFDHVRPTMDIMASHVQRREPAARVMEWVAAQDAMRSPNAPCPCGNGREFANCHGADASKSIRQG
jgi:uncharacterized protein